jgi:hypothetical protein
MHWKVLKDRNVIKTKSGLPNLNKEIYEELQKSNWRELREPESQMGKYSYRYHLIINLLIEQLIMGTLILISKGCWLSNNCLF